MSRSLRYFTLVTLLALQPEVGMVPVSSAGTSLEQKVAVTEIPDKPIPEKKTITTYTTQVLYDEQGKKEAVVETWYSSKTGKPYLQRRSGTDSSVVETRYDKVGRITSINSGAKNDGSVVFTQFESFVYDRNGQVAVQTTKSELDPYHEGIDYELVVSPGRTQVINYANPEFSREFSKGFPSDPNL